MFEIEKLAHQHLKLLIVNSGGGIRWLLYPCLFIVACVMAEAILKIIKAAGEKGNEAS